MKNKDIKKRIEDISHTTALSSTDYDFLATHMPFNKLNYSAGEETIKNRDKLSREELTEEMFIEQHILSNRDRHKMVFVKGNSGSGKSHLIRWFYNKYKNRVDENEELIILISRDSNSLKGTLNQIVSSDLFKGFHEEAEFKKIIEAGELLEEDKLREDIPALLASTIRSSDKGIKRREKDNLANFLTTDIIRDEVLFKKDGPIDRIIISLIGDKDSKSKKAEENFYAKDFEIIDIEMLRAMRDTEGDMGASTKSISMAEDIERSDSKKEEIAELLNSFVDEVIKKIIRLGHSDLQDVFKKIRSKLKEEGMNLTIFFEDITTTTGIHKELLEALIVNHKEADDDICRIVSFVGITENYYSSNIQDNIKGRITDLLDIEESSLIKDKKDLSKFIGLYMNAINQSEDKIKNWYEQGARTRDLPISSLNAEKEWSLIGLEDDKQISIYPFTEDALWNIYSSRDKEGKEPRGFLSLIINNLYYNFIDDGTDYILDMDVYSGTSIPNLRDRLDETRILNFSEGNKELKDKTETLIRIWGNGTIKNTQENGKRKIGNISEDIFNHFKLPVILGEATNDTNKDHNDKDIKKNLEETPKIEKDRNTREYEKEIESLDEWRYGEKLIKHKKYRDIIVDLYKKFINWEEEGISKYLLETMLTSAVINIEGQTVDQSRGILFKREDELYYLLLGAINSQYQGNGSWDFKDSERYILYITQYLNKHKKEVIKLIEKPKGENWELEDILLLNSYYINVLNKNIEKNFKEEELYYELFNSLESIISNNYSNLSEEWITLTNIYNNSMQSSLSQEILIKYFNLPLGVAVSKDSGNIEIYAYKVIRKIKQLMDMDWDLEEFDIKVEKSTEIYKPLEFFKKEVYKKIPNLINKRISDIKAVIESLEDKYGNNLNEENISLMKSEINIYLKEITEAGFINNKEKYNKIIYETDVRNIYNIYIKLKQIKELKNKDKLFIISEDNNKDLYKYNEELDQLYGDIKKYDKNCDAILETMSDENINYDEIITEIANIESNIVSIIDRIFEVKKC